MSADLAQFYNGLSVEDVWAGRVSAGHVLILAGQLHLNPLSRVRMIAAGGDPRWIGWDRSAELLAALYDQIASLGAGEALTDEQRYPRPSDGAPAPQETPLFAPTVASFNGDLFMHMLGS